MALRGVVIPSRPVAEVKFIADNNVGKVAKLLRMLGYDTLFFTEKDDNEMVRRAFKESRVILTRDTQIMKRRLVRDGRLKAVFIREDNPKMQLLEVLKALNLSHFRPFSLCLECNQPLIPRSREEVQDLVPIRVLNNHNRYTECPLCHRIYWEGTHWQAMAEKLKDLGKGVDVDNHCQC
jgi:hypothetical protein